MTVDNPETRWRLDNRTALVTGGTKGIGLAIADELARFGARVCTVARSDADIIDDLSDPDAPARIVAEAIRQLGGLDILVNNVGTNIRARSVDYRPEQVDQIVATNLTSVWEMCRAAYDTLAATRGCIVNIGSVAGIRAVGSGAPYAMTKAALDQLTRYLAVEWAPDNIRVNAVEPWYTRTPLAQPVLDDPIRREKILARTPLGRIAEPEDVAAAATFLCLPAARHITGICLPVDGGFLAACL